MHIIPRGRSWPCRIRALFECALIVLVLFLVLATFTEAIPDVLRKIIPDYTFHGNSEINGQTAIRLLCFAFCAALVTWICVRLTGRKALGLQLHGWQRSLALVALPYTLCVAGAIWKPGNWPLEATLALLVLGLSAATAEEVVFRGLMMRRLHIAGFSVTAVVTLQALFFALAHAGSYGVQWWKALPLAIFCGVARQYSGSLVGPIILHGTRGLFLLSMSDQPLANTLNLKCMTGLSVFWFVGFLVLEWRRKCQQPNTAPEPTANVP